jgi:3-deoxy-manno-octulosonate cytidylyltransferase (CMP-KDO synthetase)
MSATVMIPARFASTRLPGKPLLSRTGKPLIQHVLEAVRKAETVHRICVATDDRRIADVVDALGYEAVMTSRHARTGTDRLAEAAAELDLPDDEIVVNVQGDEPEIPPACIDRLVGLLIDAETPMATLVTLLDPRLAGEPGRVKVVCDARDRAMYFSRAPIPHDRDRAGGIAYLLHLGIYAYRAAFLRTFAQLPPTPCEEAEKLEQLRALEHGHPISVAMVDYDGAGIDTPDDYDAFVQRQARQGGHGPT